jgi:Cft2 family RNA processing exonuclease
MHEEREVREHRFTHLVQDIVTRGGRCLIPVFALGRAQELLLILGKTRHLSSAPYLPAGPFQGSLMNFWINLETPFRYKVWY